VESEPVRKGRERARSRKTRGDNAFPRRSATLTQTLYSGRIRSNDCLPLEITTLAIFH
jgi:hypothetical protein